MVERIKRNLVIIVKIFLGVLLLQFFLQTFVTFTLGWDGTFWNLVRMWKEFLIVILTIFVIFVGLKNKDKLSQMRRDFPLKIFVVVFLFTMLIAFVISLYNSNIINFILSARYSLFGFFVFLLFYVISYLFFNKNSGNFAKWYTKIIKWLLWGALMWWIVIWLCPAFIELFGYNQWNYEGKVGEQPPVAYYTQYRQGYVRNQFLFERPISLGFFLVAFWPLFFILILYKKGVKNWILWGGLYGIIILSTFSRAARGAWLIQTVIMFFMLYRKNNKKRFLWFLIPVLLLLGIVVYFGRDQIIYRDYSNSGHIKELQIAVQKIKESPFWGRGAASAGPASHHLGAGKEYNPENQYLQIWLEYGLLAFVGWMFLYIYMHVIGIRAYKTTFLSEKTNKELKHFSLIVYAFSLGLLGLSIEGFVLHSFVDRMIVYPYVVLFGIYYAIYYRAKLYGTKSGKVALSTLAPTLSDKNECAV